MRNPFKRNKQPDNQANQVGLGKEYIQDLGFSDERANDINGAIRDNHAEITSTRKEAANSVAKRGFFRRLMAGGAIAAIAVGGVKAGEKIDEHGRAVDANNAGLATQIEDKVKENEMAKQVSEISEATDSQVAAGQKSDQEAANQANHEEAVANGEDIVKAAEESKTSQPQ